MTTPTAPAFRLAHDGFPERVAFFEHDDTHTLVEVELEPGGGTPLHVHLDYAEHFEVLEGHLDIELGGTTTRLRRGERCTAPATVPHRFFNSSDHTARFLVTLDPGQRGFIEMQLVFFGLRADGRVDADGNPRDPRHVAAAFGWSHSAPPAAGGAFAMRVFRAVARMTGEERRLRQRYVEPAADRIAQLNHRPA